MGVNVRHKCNHSSLPFAIPPVPLLLSISVYQEPGSLAAPFSVTPDLLKNNADPARFSLSHTVSDLQALSVCTAVGVLFGTWQC